jgi:photosystem II stability/assembly factor-like uncharacterized protein
MTPRHICKLYNHLVFLTLLLSACAAAAYAQEPTPLPVKMPANLPASLPPGLEELRHATGSWRITNVAAIDLAVSPATEAERARVWQMTGPFGGDVKTLVIDPRNSDRILIGTNDGQLFRTTDGGQIWRRLRPGIKAPGFAITSIMFDQARTGTIFVGAKQVRDAKDDATGGGLFVTADNGESWRELTELRARSVLGIVQAAKDPDTLVTVARDGVYLSQDHGASWRRITPENDKELTGFHSAAIDPRDPQTIFVGTWHLPWKTTDSGQTWKLTGMKETGMIDDSDIFSIQIDEAKPDAMWMCACSGIYRSTDGSANWTKIKGIPYSARRTHVIYQHPANPDLVFAGTIEGLWRSLKGGAPDTWKQVTPRLVINAIAVHPDKPERVFIGTENYGVLISNDFGETYELSNAGFINRYVNTVVADRTERGRIYAGVLYDEANGGFFISEDGGITWKQSIEGMGVRDVYSIHQSETSPETLYAGTNHGLFRSDDRGLNWTAVKKQDLAAEAEVQALTAKTAKSGVAVQPKTAAGKARPLKQPQRVVQTVKPNSRKAATSPRNKKPAAKPATPPEPEPVEEFVDLENQVFLLTPFPLRQSETASAESAPPASEPPASALSDGSEADAPKANRPTHGFIAATWNGLYRSTDEKQGWKALNLSGSSEPANPTGETAGSARLTFKALAASPHAPGLLLIGTEAGLFISRDNGETFAALPLGEKSPRVRTINFDPRTAETVYVGTTEGFFRSLDGGQTWEQRGGGMPMLVEVNALVINQLNPDELYLGDQLRGAFFHSLDRGKNWEALDISALPSVWLNNLTSDPFNPNRLYVGSYSGGVYVMSRQ